MSSPDLVDPSRNLTQVRQSLDHLVGSESNSYSCLSKETTLRVHSLLRFGDLDHIEVHRHTRKSALMRTIAAAADFDFDPEDYSSPRKFTKPELLAIERAVKDEVEAGAGE